jgi:hypothetical protein
LVSPPDDELEPDDDPSLDVEVDDDVLLELDFFSPLPDLA